MVVRSSKDGLVDELGRVGLALLHDLHGHQGCLVLVLRKAKAGGRKKTTKNVWYIKKTLESNTKFVDIY